MMYSRFIKQIAGIEGDLEEEDAYRLYAAMLDDGVPELELGAISMALAAKGESLSELQGFYRALSERIYPLRYTDRGVRPVVLPSYNGARTQPNLLPVLALLLHRFGVPVLVHGTLNGHGSVASAYIFRDLNVMPSVTLPHAQQALDNDGIAFVPTAVLAPGLAKLLALRERLGVRNTAHILAKLIDPFGEEALRVVSLSEPTRLARAREVLLSTGASALLLRSTEGEPFADPVRRPRIEWLHEGHGEILFQEEVGTSRPVTSLPHDIDAHSTAVWIRHALAREAPLPLPIVNQLACCLYASGYTHDLNQAKAIVAVETGSLAA